MTCHGIENPCTTFALVKNTEINIIKQVKSTESKRIVKVNNAKILLNMFLYLYYFKTFSGTEILFD